MSNLSANDLLKKVRKIEIKTRALSHQIFAGEYHSAFKGRGMAFSEVREYQYGDDVRNMDWNVTARLRSPYVKVFEEERDLQVSTPAGALFCYARLPANLTFILHTLSFGFYIDWIRYSHKIQKKIPK